MDHYFTVLEKQTLWVRLIALTAYLALVNSYALFVLYPALKTTDVAAYIFALAIYAIISLPLILYILKRFRPRPNRLVIAGGLVVMAIATIIQFFISHTPIPVLLLHALFYLCAGVVEETLWRGKLWQFVSEKVKSQWAIMGIITGHFVLLHVPFAILEKPSALGFLGQVLALGVALGVLRIVTKHVTVPAFAHAIVNMIVYT